MNQFHTGVLEGEVIRWINLKPKGKYIDATIGGGGYSQKLLEGKANVLGIDRDPESIEFVKNKNLKNLILENANFNQISTIAKKHNFTSVNGIVFDLGVSSFQLEKSSRGFSFMKKGPLDMRMDHQIQITAAELVNNLDKRRLNEVIKTYSNEKLSWPISDAICFARKIKPIETTEELALIIKKVYAKYKLREKINPATKTFQALRIVVNSELLNLEEALPQTVEILGKGGRLVIISFHSLEDGIVKRFLNNENRLRVLTKKPIGPTFLEIQGNPRSRSAKLRVAEKI